MINLTLNKKVIIFGFIFTFFSSFGQSFFLGLFNAPIRNELGISHVNLVASMQVQLFFQAYFLFGLEKK